MVTSFAPSLSPTSSIPIYEIVLEVISSDGRNIIILNSVVIQLFVDLKKPLIVLFLLL